MCVCVCMLPKLSWGLSYKIVSSKMKIIESEVLLFPCGMISKVQGNIQWDTGNAMSNLPDEEICCSLNFWWVAPYTHTHTH